MAAGCRGAMTVCGKVVGVAIVAVPGVGAAASGADSGTADLDSGSNFVGVGNVDLAWKVVERQKSMNLDSNSR